MLDLVTREDEDKTRRLRKAMENEAIDALILRLPEDILYISGYWPFFGLSHVFFPLDGEPSIITITDEEPYARRSWVKNILPVRLETFDRLGEPVKCTLGMIRRLAEDSGITNGVMGYEGSMEFFSTNYQRREFWSVGPTFYHGLCKLLPRAEIKDIGPLMYDLRSIKTSKEVEAMRIVNMIADVGLEAFHNAIEEGRREVDIQAAVEHEVLTRGVGCNGVERLVAIAFVTSGRNSVDAYKVCSVSTGKKLQRGEVVLLELNVNVEGYWSDTTRTYVIGTPNEQQKRYFDAVTEAQQAAIDKIEDGVPSSEVDRVAFDVVKNCGLAKYLRHGLGHGTGCNLHEPIPALHHASKHVLRANMIHSVEPGLYDPDLGGIRVEDMILDTKHGAERLSRYDLGGQFGT